MNYFEHPAINHSGLMLLKKSPLHFISKIQKPPTPDMMLGSAIHCAVLEPDKFAERFFYIDQRTKKGKEIAESLLKDQCALPPSAQKIVEGVYESFQKSEIAKLLIKYAAIETPIFWKDEVTGEDCKAKPDAVNSSAIIDLKTTSSADKNSFSKAIFEFNMHTQSCFYLDGYYQSTGKRIDDFYFIALEKEPPYALAIYEVKRNSRMMDEARIVLRRLLDKYHECKTKNEWPGYSEVPEPIDLPPWVYRETFI